MHTKRTLCAWLLTAALALGLLPIPALAADPVPFAALAGETELTAARSETDYTYTETLYDASWNPVGTADHTAPLYVVTVPAGTGAVTLDFGQETRLAYAYTASGDYAAACGDYGDGTVGKTTAQVTDLTQFIRVQTPYDADWNSELLYAVAFETEAAPAGVPFAALAGETELAAVRSETDYAYTETLYDASWNPVGTADHTAPLYVVTVPAGTGAVTLDFGQEARLAYAYTASGDYAAACGDYGDGTVGKTTAQVTDLTQFIRVQTPYDADWNSELLYAVAFETEAAPAGAPFAALAGETELAAARSETDYAYTETLYDASWNPVGTADHTAPLYVVTVPAGTGAVTLDFGQETRLAYAYTASGDYAAACGDYGDGTVGKTTAQVTDLTQFIRVQTPYDADWNSELLYAVAFDAESGSQTAGQADLDALIANVGAAFAANEADWAIVSAGMYETLGGPAPDSAAVQARVDAIAGRMEAARVSDTDAAKAILGLRACGLDPRSLTTASGRKVDVVAKLTATTTTNLYNAPYVLLAYQQGDYDAQKEDDLVAFLLDSQGEDGSWATSPDTTGIVLAALADRAGDETVAAAMDRGAAYLLASISPAGTCSSIWSSDNADTTAMALIGLAAAGVEPGEARNGADGVPIAQGLMRFALADNSGFGYTDASAWNEIATRDGFWAALCVRGGAGTRLFDFTQNPALPAAATAAPVTGTGSSGSAPAPAEKTMSVTFSVVGSNGVWMSARTVKVPEGATAMDALRRTLDDSPAFSYVESSGYLRSITYNGVLLGEFTEGPNSGWKYAVNGEAPMVGMGSFTLSAGDRLSVYYVQDYTQDATPNQGGATFPSGSQQGGGSSSGSSGSSGPVKPDDPAPAFPFADASEHPARAAIAFCRERGIMNGTGPDAFSPDAPFSRGMLITVLYNLEGRPAAEAVAFADVAPGAWYARPIGWAVEAGLCAGYGGGRFGPEDGITREQIELILRRFARRGQLDEGRIVLPDGAADAGITRAEAAELFLHLLGD